MRLLPKKCNAACHSPALEFFREFGMVFGMTEDNRNKKIELNISEGKIVLENVIEEVIPAVKPGISAIGSILSVAANAFGLTAEIFNDVIDNMRKMYREGVLKIPAEHRRKPPFRIASEVLEETVKCVEEPELHKLFANLLIAASDTRRKSEIHPGFAKAIGQLTSVDAKIISHLADGNVLSLWTAEQNEVCSAEEFAVSSINLLQLGIADWMREPASSFFAYSAVDQFERVRITVPRQTVAPNFYSSSMGEAKTEGLRDAAKSLADQVKSEIDKTSKREYIQLSEYGRLFAKACLDLPAADAAEIGKGKEPPQ